MASKFKKLFGLTSGPEKATDTMYDPAVGWLVAEFDPFKPDPRYDWDARQSGGTAWPTIVPVTPGPYEPISRTLQRLIDSTWQRAEPAKGAQRGAIQIGQRAATGAWKNEDVYSPHIAPVNDAKSREKPGEAAIAHDWKTFKQIERTNAVTFRGDTRGPVELIQTAGGFYPPSTRTDRYYIENGIYPYFATYMKKRYDREISKVDFLSAVDQSTSPDAVKIFVDYMMWRKITEGESMHLGRMVAHECLKGYISTSRSIDKSIGFGTRFGKQDGWIYVTLVRGGFVVPADGVLWGSSEQEIAQWGPVVSADVVGFARLTKLYRPAADAPIYFRRSFRHKEPKAFLKMHAIMSGWVP